MSSPSYNSHSPSSTISELNSPLLSISTRRPRTRRKRPNQTHDEAVALLSTVYPTIFSSSSMLKPPPPPPPLSDYDFLMPFDQESDFRFNPSILMKPEFHHLFEHDDKRVLNLGGDIKINEWEGNGFGIFDEEVEEGIDSFMGSIESGRFCQYQIQSIGRLVEMIRTHPSSMALKSALRVNDDDVNWCRFATVEFEQISPEKEVAPVEAKCFEQSSKLLLKLDYDGVLEVWSDKESPFSDNSGRLSEIDLFGESGIRESSVLRYKEKRRNRLFSKSNSNKIRYQVRKLNADQRPRIKGRFVRSSNIRNLRRRAERI